MFRRVGWLNALQCHTGLLEELERVKAEVQRQR